MENPRSETTPKRSPLFRCHRGLRNREISALSDSKRNETKRDGSFQRAKRNETKRNEEAQGPNSKRNETASRLTASKKA